jgi:uncharacterized tellurite resistance protein B-like protein
MASHDWSILDEEFAVVKGGMEEHEAFYAILASSMMCDGDRDKREEEELKALSHRSVALQKFRKEKESEFETMTKNVLKKFEGLMGADLAKRAIAVCTEAAIPIRAKGDEMAFSVYSHAVDIIFADGKVLDQERAFLKHLGEEIGLSPRDAVEILRFLNRKNKY